MFAMGSPTFNALAVPVRPTAFGQAGCAAPLAQRTPRTQAVANVLSLSAATHSASVVATRPTLQRLTIGVQPHMIRARQQLKILKAVVRLIKVAMMHDQSVRDRPVSMFPNEMVFKYTLAARQLDTDVAACHATPAVPTDVLFSAPRQAITSHRAKPITALCKAVGAREKRNAALVAGSGDGTLGGHRSLSLRCLAGGVHSAARPSCVRSNSTMGWSGVT